MVYRIRSGFIIFQINKFHNESTKSIHFSPFVSMSEYMSSNLLYPLILSRNSIFSENPSRFFQSLAGIREFTAFRQAEQSESLFNILESFGIALTDKFFLQGPDLFVCRDAFAKSFETD